MLNIVGNLQGIFMPQQQAANASPDSAVDRVPMEWLSAPGSNPMRDQKKITSEASGLARSGNPVDAIAMLEEGLIRYPENYYFLGQLGHLYRRTGKLAEAASCMERGRILNAGDIKTLSALGAVYAEQGLYAKAEFVLQEARTIDPSDLFVVVTLAGAYIAQEKYEAAEGLLSHSRGVDRRNKYVMASLGVVRILREDFGGARDVLELGYMAHPRDPYIVNLLGTVCGELGDYEAAEHVLTQGLRMEPRNRFICASLASVQVRQRKFAEALRALSSGIRFNTRDVVLLNLTGAAQLGLGDDAAAFDTWQAALRVDPGNVAVTTSLGHLCLKRRDFAMFEALAAAAADNEDDESFLYLRAKSAFLQNDHKATQEFCRHLFTIRGFEPQAAILYLACTHAQDAVNQRILAKFGQETYADFTRRAGELRRDPARLDRYDPRYAIVLPELLSGTFSNRPADADAVGRTVAAALMMVLIGAHVALHSTTGFHGYTGLLGIPGGAAAAGVLALFSGQMHRLGSHRHE